MELLTFTFPILTLDKEAIDQIALYSMIPFVGAFIFIVFIFYRRSRENHIQKELLNLELTALRAQMNPHFIFNCLNAIYNSIQANRNEEAGDYLLKFTFLTRRILENSNNKWITLEEDITMLKAYCELEKIRLTQPFSFEIQCKQEEQLSEAHVPMLLLQPLFENIIWHGLTGTLNAYIVLQIEVSKKNIKYEMRSNVLPSVKKPTNPKPGKQKSLGRKLVMDQLEAIGQLSGEKTVFEEKTNSNGAHLEHFTTIILPHVELPRIK